MSSCCPQCLQNYQRELAKLSQVKPEVSRPSLPQWLHNAKSQDAELKTADQVSESIALLLLGDLCCNQDSTLDFHQNLVINPCFLLQNKDHEQKCQELQKKWNDTCLDLHPNFHKPNLGPERIVPSPISMTGLYNPNLLVRQSFQPKLQLNGNLGNTLQLNSSLLPSQPSERAASPPNSPVRTELALGRPKISASMPEKNHKDHVRDFLGCLSSESQNSLQTEKLDKAIDVDSMKRLLKGLMEKVWWQQEAASAIATTVTQCKMGNGKPRGTGSKGDIWLLFTGPDRVGKKKMASALSELVNGTNPIMISLGSRRDDDESNISFRGKTALDKIGEAVRRNPFSVIVLEDIDEADVLIRGSIKRAMERGRLADSHGREISLGNVIFILTATWLPDSVKFLSSGDTMDEKRLERSASSGWQLKLTVLSKTSKRRADWVLDEERPTKPRKETCTGLLSLDLNKIADTNDDGSHNSSDVTTEHEEEHAPNNNRLVLLSSQDLLNTVDDSIVFKPVDFGPIKRDVRNSITKKLSNIVSKNLPLEIPDESLERIVSGVWLGKIGLEEWTEKVVVPSLQQLKSRLPSNADEWSCVRLDTDEEVSGLEKQGDLLPTRIRVAVE